LPDDKDDRDYVRKDFPDEFHRRLPEHCLITPVNLSVHIHDPLYNGPGIVLGIVPVDAEFTAAILGVPMQGPDDVMQMVDLHLFDRNCSFFGRP